MRNLFCGLLLLAFASASRAATTHYVDFVAGADTNNGTSTGTPWKHAPGMTGATSNAAAYSCTAGDQIILRGGVTWDYTTLPWTWPCGGSAGSHVYVGGDPSQVYYNSTNCSGAGYAGFCRPIINAGGATGCAGSPCYDQTTTANHTLVLNQANVDLGYTEFTGLYWGGNAAANFGSAFYISAQSLSNSNVHDNYFHGWAHAAYPTSIEGQGCCAVILGNTGNSGNAGVLMYNNVVDGSDTDKQSFGVSYGGPPQWQNNYFNYAWSDAFDGSYSLFSGNTLLNVGISYAAAGGIHDNGFESNTAWSSGGTTGYELIYNNYISHINQTAGTSEGLVVLWTAPQSGQTSYIFNNVMADLQSFGGGDNNLMCEKAIAGTPGGRCVYFNNTVECGGDAVPPSGTCGSYDTATPNPVVGVTVINNHFITSGTCPTLSIHGGGSPSSTYTTNLCQSKTTTNGQGYTLAQTYPFSPTSGGGGTVGAGTNEVATQCASISSLNAAAGTACLSDSVVGVGYDATNHIVVIPNRAVNTRPSSAVWDSGAYEFGLPAATTPVPSPVGGSYSSTQSVTLTAATGGVICYNMTGAPATNGTTACAAGSTLYVSTLSVGATQTIYAVAGGTGFADSAVGLATYVINPYGSNTYRNGYGLGDGPVPTTRSNAMCPEINAGGSPCIDPDFPLGGTGSPSIWVSPSAAAAQGCVSPTQGCTAYVTAVGPNWMAAAWAIDPNFNPATGKVTTLGTTVTWVSGYKFITDGTWTGQPIKINNVTYTISVVNSTTSITTTTTLPTLNGSPPGTGVAYALASSVAAQTISARGSADAGLNQLSYDGTAFCFSTSLGSRSWFSSFSMTTGAAAPLLEVGGTGYSFGGGICNFSKVPIETAPFGSVTNPNGHVAYVYCVAPNNPGLCAVDPYTGVVAVIADFSTSPVTGINGNFPSCGNPPGCTLNGTPSGTGGEIDLTRDLLGTGVGTVASLSIGTSGEPENGWRYLVNIYLANGAIQWWDVKNDMTGGSNNWPGGIVTCSTPAVTHGLCTGIAAAPSSDIFASCAGVLTPCVQCAGAVIAGCQGIHGVGVQVDYLNNAYGNVSLESNCTITSCAVAGPTMFTVGFASGCSSGTVTTGLCATISTVLNGAGHRASVGGGNIGVASGTTGTLVAIASQAPTVQVMCEGALVPPNCLGAPTIGNPGTDGHDTGNASDNVGTSATQIGGHGLLHFGSFYNGLANAGKSPGMVGNGTTLTITCSNNPCFYQSVAETGVFVQGSTVAGFNGTWNVVGGGTGIGTNVITLANTTVATDVTGKAAMTPTSCANPTASGMDEDVFYSPKSYDLDGSGKQRNYRIRHTMMDTCANGQSFYNLVNATVNAQGNRLVESTNHNCALGLDNTGDCLKVLEITEVIPGGSFVSINSIQIQGGVQVKGGVALH